MALTGHCGQKCVDRLWIERLIGRQLQRRNRSMTVRGVVIVLVVMMMAVVRVMVVTFPGQPSGNIFDLFCWRVRHRA